MLKTTEHFSHGIARRSHFASMRVKFPADFVSEKIKALKKESQLAGSLINSYCILSLHLVFSRKTFHSSHFSQRISSSISFPEM
jgi:hypothetical protein